MAMQQFTVKISCSKCRKPYIVSFKALNRKKFLAEAVRMQNEEICSDCDKGKGHDAASRELQASGLAPMYRPTAQKPHIMTDENGNKTWAKHETKTEKALRECGA
jgi:hypothetical protein